MSDEQLKVCVYTGGLNLIKKSGVGKAIYHQTAVLKMQGFSVNEFPLKDCDVVHINSIFPNSVFTAKKAKRHGVKVVYYGHSTMEDFRNSFVGSNFLAPAFKKWIIHCYRLGDVIITPTPYSKSILEGYGTLKNIYALSNGIELSFWNKETENNENSKKEFFEKYAIPTGNKVIMSVGHYMKRKGILDFITLAKSNPDKTFIWFGHTDKILIPSEIQKAMKSKPDNLIFAGYVNSEELRTAYSCCDLFLFLSYEETEGIVVLEAMACEIPMIVRDIPVYDGWLTDRENVFKFKKNEQLCELLNNVLSLDTSSVTENALETAQSRSFGEIGRKLTDIYNSLTK